MPWRLAGDALGQLPTCFVEKLYHARSSEYLRVSNYSELNRHLCKRSTDTASTFECLVGSDMTEANSMIVE